MTWALRIPHRSRGDSLADIADAARTLEGDDRATARALVVEAAIEGIETAGGLLDHVEQLDPDQRRGLLDRARTRAGLPTTESVGDDARIESAQRSARARAQSGRLARYAYTDVGTLVDLNERDDEIAREQAREESRRHQREQLEAARQQQAAEQDAANQARREAMVAESPQLRGSR